MSTTTLVQTGKGQRERRKEDWTSNLAKVPSCCAVRPQKGNQVRHTKQGDSSRKRGNVFRYKEGIASKIISQTRLLLLNTHPEAKCCSIKRGYRERQTWQPDKPSFKKKVILIVRQNHSLVKLSSDNIPRFSEPPALLGTHVCF